MPVRNPSTKPQPKKQPQSASRPSLNICIVTRDLYGWSEPADIAATTVGLAQHFAAQGDSVTLIWVPPNDDADHAPISKLTDYFFNNYLIKLEVMTSSRHFMPGLWGSEKASAAVYYHLREHKFDVVYFTLEGGLAYYTLHAKELGLFEPRPIINVLVDAPIVWQARADRHFLENMEQVTIAHLEKYCVGQPDSLICASAYILDWMKEQGWSVASDARVLPNLRPFEWQLRGQKQTEQVRNINEVVFFSGPEFQNGLTLLCDALDVLAGKVTKPFTVTFLGRFGRILGEHTGGMVLRRSRRWPFELKIMPRLTDQQIVGYLKGRKCLAVIPRHTANTPLDLAICLEEGVPFVSTDVGGIPEMIEAKSLAYSTCPAKPAMIAEKIMDALATPRPAKPGVSIADKQALWNSHLDDTAVEVRRSKSRPSGKPAGKKPLVTIVLVHHDRPKYLKQALESIENQDYPNFELILVDDGSALPESRKMLDELERPFKKRGWRILREENKYPGAARNAGIRAARGERILFVDDDNALFKHAVTTYVNAMDASGADICPSFQRIFHEDFIPADEKFGLIHYFPLGGSLDLGFIHDTFGDTNAMIRRSVFDKIGLMYDEYGYSASEWEFYARATLAGLKVRIIPDPLYWYRSRVQGLYRTSHWYQNRLPVLATYRKYGFAGLEYIYDLVLSANVTHAEKQGYRENLRHGIADTRYFALSNLDPKSDDAINLLAEIAAAEGRPDTALILLGRSKSPDFRERAGDSLKIRELADRALVENGHEFRSETLLDQQHLKEFSILSSDRREPVPLSYIEGKDRLYLQARQASISLAVKSAACPVGTVSVSSTVWLDQAIATPTEFLILLIPEDQPPLLAVEQATGEAGEGSSGWLEVAHAFKSLHIEARFSLPSSRLHNLVLAVRNKSGSPAKTTLGCFSWISVSKSLGFENARHPRLGPPPQQQRAREWTSDERHTAKLVTNYPSPVPLLLFPSHSEGLFLRPNSKGNVIASLPWAFPPFARSMVGTVEIAHEDASSFEFAMALARPEESLRWTGDKPAHALAFSGWLKVERNFELHQLSLEIREIVRTHLSVNLAIRLASGSKPNPANAFWRKLVFLWDE